MELQVNLRNYAERQVHPYFSIDNPYNDRLKIFDDFVMLDLNCEIYRGKWKNEVFQNQKPLHVEIGTGFGEFMHEFCLNHPDLSYVGMDYRFKRGFDLARRLAQIKVKNFKYLRASAARLTSMFAPEEVNTLHYYFPDPWPKFRHHKRRLFQKPFLDMCSEILAPGGALLVKTDHDEYFQWMLEHFAEYEKENQSLSIIFKTFDLHNEETLPVEAHFFKDYKTKFEKMFMDRKTPIKAMVIKKVWRTV
jgi:tRNA (guanine-N7-)-methyltransferase